MECSSWYFESYIRIAPPQTPAAAGACVVAGSAVDYDVETGAPRAVVSSLGLRLPAGRSARIAVSCKGGDLMMSRKTVVALGLFLSFAGSGLRAQEFQDATQVAHRHVVGNKGHLRAHA